MSSKLTITSATILALTLSAGIAHAQVFVRAPFVRVYVGPGDVSVRAPFVNLNIPTGPPPVYYSLPTEVVPGGVVQPPVVTSQYPLNVESGDPQPLQVQYPTLDQFARGFQPKAGSYEVTLLNPVSGQPTAVRFTLPEGTPRVMTRSRNVEFQYNSRQWVRLEFDRNGVTVVSR